MQGVSSFKRIRSFMGFHGACQILLPTDTYFWRSRNKHFSGAKVPNIHCELLCRGSGSLRKRVHGNTQLYSRHHEQYETMAAYSRSTKSKSCIEWPYGN